MKEIELFNSNYSSNRSYNSSSNRSRKGALLVVGVLGAFFFIFAFIFVFFYYYDAIKLELGLNIGIERPYFIFIELSRLNILILVNRVLLPFYLGLKRGKERTLRRSRSDTFLSGIFSFKNGLFGSDGKVI